MLLRPGIFSPYRGSQRPLWPFIVNRYSPQAEGLIAWWPFAPAGGDILRDLSDNLNHGTLTNMEPGTDWVSNPVLGSHSLSFDGVNELVNVGDIDILDGLGAASWVLWLNRTGDGEDDSFISKWTDGSSTTFSFELDTGGDGQFFIAQSSTSLGQAFGLLPAGAVSLNQWHHFAIVFDGSGATDADRFKFYLNGSQVTLTYPGSELIPSSLFASTADFEIAGFTDQARFWPGEIADVRIYNRALTAAEAHEMWSPSTRWDLAYPLRQNVMPFAAPPQALTGGSGNSPIFRVKHSPWGYM